MDVGRTEDIVKPSAAGRWRKRDLWAVLLTGAVIALPLIITVAEGRVDAMTGVLILATAMALFAFARAIQRARARPAEIASFEGSELKRLRRYAELLDALPQPVMLLDAEDRVELANAAYIQAFGDEGVGSHISAAIRSPSALEVLREARHSHAPREAEFTLSAPREYAALFYVAPLESSGSETGEMVVMVRDRTEQKKLERMRTDFIANASHELRTPLAALLGFIETLQGHAKDDPDAQARFLKIMQGQTERMLRLVRDLVSLSALELNERRLPSEKVDLTELVLAVREMMVQVAKSSGGEIGDDPLMDGPLPIMGDRDQLTQVIQNLTDNALKYGGPTDDSPARVHIEVGRGARFAFQGAERSGDSPEQIAVRADCKPSELVYLRVRDEGRGIDSKDLPRLTERFYRIDVERSRTKGGTGLGLAIVKHIVNRHRGGILVESAKGRGSAFTCYFPPFKVANSLETEVFPRHS
ncbi:MAG: ATP-binding protein [Parvularcula sp.]|jgi:two-component system phosphate regulon sensor histidine kinase PhoR|nr:ATP-binding protein [Parvularcula sp.]